jgi:regulation of enolase protein 1 (concanavalin A-like superfamily)
MAVLIICGSLSCSNEPKTSNTLKPKSNPAPTLPPGVKVDRPINVSFSTYSSDWPVEWQWIDPDESKSPTPHDTKAAVLRVRVPNGKDMRPGNMSAPRFVKAISGNFHIETGVHFAPKENYQGAGLLIYVDDLNFVRFERAYGGQGGGGEGLRMIAIRNGELQIITTPADLPTEAVNVQLKISRTGDMISAFWRENEYEEWRAAGAAEFRIPETVISGVIVCNTARETIAEFRYIRLLPPRQD